MITIRRMLRFVKLFLGGISLYFVAHTIVVYGFLDGHYKEIFSTLKELLRVGAIIFVWLSRTGQSIQYIKRTKKSLIVLGIMFLIGLLVTFLHTDTLSQFARNSIIGIKYWRYMMALFRSAWMVWYCYPAVFWWSHTTQELSEKNGQLSEYSFVAFIVRLSWRILRWWLLLQLCKILSPESWYALWFWELNIYRPWFAPPLYYLTKQDGLMRYSWLFAWPNNAAFWIVALSPLLRHYASSSSLLWKKWLFRLSLLLFGLINIGRSIIVGRFGQIVYAFSQVGRRHLYSRLLKIVIGTMIVIVAGISLLKRDSTVKHFDLSVRAFEQFTSNPRWYGLWSSGPGIHRNGSLLPENYYLQLALDYGRAWPVCFFLFWRIILGSIKQTGSKQRWLHQIHGLFLQGFVGLLIVWLFLHVFEDSMVNYLFFVPRWIVYGMLLFGDFDHDRDAHLLDANSTLQGE